VVSGAPGLDAFDFELPAERIAQRPLAERVASRLLCWHHDGSFAHRGFADLIELLRPDDLLVLNDTRVFPARLFGTKSNGEARIEVLLVRVRADRGATIWEALVRPGRRVPPGSTILLDGDLPLRVGARTEERTVLVEFPADVDVIAHCRVHGHVPLPPYIERADDEEDTRRYQTTFARNEGSVAAPTAGLHFDDALLARVRESGVHSAWVTLHVGPGTFRPPEPTALALGQLHSEWREVPHDTVRALADCRARGGRVVAVGTTVCRALESLPEDARDTVRGDTRLFLRPGHRFRWCDVLVTNFHLPRSSLLMLVAAFAGERWREAYALAVREGYRFYSYGDANWIESTTMAGPA
jgi:S-adenosylmethionine:tRNA ribosyltransferase-isomerase